MVDVNPIIVAVIAIPLAILIAVSVFGSMAINSRSSFEGAVINESLKDNNTAGSGTYRTADAIVPETETVFCGITQLTRNTNYTIDYYYAIDSSEIVLDSNCGTDQDISYANVSYTGYTGTGYDTYSAMYSQTTQATQLGSLMPFVLIALALVSAIVGVFGISKAF